MERVAMYLRKSRADLEEEMKGEGETLAKHKKNLLQVAKDKKLNIIKIYQEIVSGESLIHRPEMLKLMEEVSNQQYNAVLCMDMDRLGRGDMQDQGFILKTFKKSKTKIITPRKIYDLDDQFDEEYSEFEAFMARKEFNIIKRRLENGRIRSVQEGNYIGARAPYGYQKTGDLTLIPDPETAPIVKMIFQWYTSDDPNERLGTTNIAKKLNQLGIPSYTGSKWSNNVILQIIKNPIYIGKVRWKTVERVKSTNPSKKVDARNRREDEKMLVDGKHEAIISDEAFQKAQDIRINKRNPRWKPATTLKNPLAGLIICGVCGGSITLTYSRSKYKWPHLVCTNKGRGGYCNKSSRLEHIEKKILQSLYDWLESYKLKINPEDYVINDSNTNIYEQTMKSLKIEINDLRKQQDRLHDLLERGIYDEDTFIARSQKIASRLDELNQALNQTSIDLELENERSKAKLDIIPKIENILDIYTSLESVKEKNMLLKTIIDHCIYTKEKHQKNDEFSIVIHPKI
ncbi:recombinase family protein [Shimazuella kribbensis]|uniref:recombinase family protein n=1 Tax=Shimazuella kribbensis TaxID=139808 RepID=UPI0004158541|nr:recombinase family protein [Shimazuella kribbensis]